MVLLIKVKIKCDEISTYNSQCSSALGPFDNLLLFFTTKLNLLYELSKTIYTASS